MPLYDYRCEHCGDFTELRKLSESADPVACVECGELAVRVISAPYLALMDRNTRVAKERNEKSAHEPRHARRSSCGCSGSHTCKTSSTDSTKTAAQANSNPNGLMMQTKKTARPWMLGH